MEVCVPSSPESMGKAWRLAGWAGVGIRSFPSSCSGMTMSAKLLLQGAVRSAPVLPFRGSRPAKLERRRQVRSQGRAWERGDISPPVGAHHCDDVYQALRAGLRDRRAFGPLEFYRTKVHNRL